ncbi:hypothetical protein FB451DRAFT_1191610 [Mycena latifolia]|nr:hypothetical protein FB451DRAFT_1191610 [Mycena latifolia]
MQCASRVWARLTFLTSPRHAVPPHTSTSAPPCMPPIVHKLTAAMMLEPSAGSKLLAEELDNELDEGAEGIDNFAAPPRPQIHVRGTDGDGAGELSLTSAERGPQLTGAFEDVP